MEKIKFERYFHKSAWIGNDDSFPLYAKEQPSINQKDWIKCTIEITPVEPEITECPLCGGTLIPHESVEDIVYHQDRTSCCFNSIPFSPPLWRNLARQVEKIREGR